MLAKEFEDIAIKAGEHFPRLRKGLASLDLAHLQQMFEPAEALVRGAALNGFRIKVVTSEVTICSPRHPAIAFYARPVAGGSVVSFNFHPSKDARLTHLKLTEGEAAVSDTYYCFHRKHPAEIQSFLETVRLAEEALP